MSLTLKNWREIHFYMKVPVIPKINDVAKSATEDTFSSLKKENQTLKKAQG